MSAPSKPLPPADDDPLASAFPVRRNLPAFLFSAGFHAVLLLLLTTISVTVAKQVQKINVKIIPPPPEAIEDAEVEGAPSLKDIAGELRPVMTMPNKANSVAGPSSAAPAPAPVRAVEMPRIAMAPSVGAQPGSLDIPLGIGASGLTAGSGPGGGGFGDLLGGLRKVGVDLVLLIDTTNSMQSVIDDVKNQAREFIGNLQQMVPASRVAVVAYRDKGDEYVTKWVDFSFKTDKVQNFVANLRADGGDYAEAVYEGLEAAMNELSWRKTSRRIMIIIGSSPPHAETMPALLKLVRDFKEQNGAIGAIDVTKRLHDEYERADWVAHGSQGTFTPTPMPAFYKEVSDSYSVITGQGGGELAQLGEDKSLLRQVMILTFGTRWRVEMAKYMGKLQ